MITTNKLVQVHYTLKMLKVGDETQFVSYLEADYRLGNKLNVDLGYRFVDNLYPDYSITDSEFTQLTMQH